MDKKEIGRAIKLERPEQGLTLYGLASRVGGTASNRYNNGNGQAPSLPLAHSILRILKRRLVIGYVEGRKSLELGAGE